MKTESMKAKEMQESGREEKDIRKKLILLLFLHSFTLLIPSSSLLPFLLASTTPSLPLSSPFSPFLTFPIFFNFPLFHISYFPLFHTLLLFKPLSILFFSSSSFFFLHSFHLPSFLLLFFSSLLSLFSSPSFFLYNFLYVIDSLFFPCSLLFFTSVFLSHTFYFTSHSPFPSLLSLPFLLSSIPSHNPLFLTFSFRYSPFFLSFLTLPFSLLFLSFSSLLPPFLSHSSPFFASFRPLSFLPLLCFPFSQLVISGQTAAFPCVSLAFVLLLE